MKKHQFEEIVFLLSTMISVLSWHFEFYLLSWIFAIKAVFDFLCCFWVIYRKHRKKIRAEASKEAAAGEDAP